MPRQRKRTRPDEPESQPEGEGPRTIFPTEASNVVPGELILEMREDVAAHITESIPTGPTRLRAIAGPSSFGVTPLDQALGTLKVTAITRLHPPVSPATAAMTEALSMASTFRIRYDARVDADSAAERLSDVDGVVYAEPNRYRETYLVPNDPSFATQWGLTHIKCPAAWDRTTGAANVVVAVIDTGVDLDHPELAPLLVQGQDMVDLGPNPTPPPGFRFEGDFMGRDNVPQDDVGHGTHVAGTIACQSNNGIGVAGVTWACRVMPVRVLARIVNVTNPNDVRGTGSAADIAAGIRWAVDHGARVLNLSLGGPVDTQVERDAIAYAIAQGAVVVAAMGNGFQQGNATSFPAAYPNVIAVGAITQANQRAVFSQTGAHIDVVAPGVGILSTVWDNGYATYQGTSMASPHVAGVAALILSCNAGLTGPQVADIIRQTATALRDVAADPVPNDRYGHGCVDAQAAVNRACPSISRPVIRCPSVVTICPSQPLRCPPSRPHACPSIISVCASTLTCPSRPIASCPSVVTICPSVTTICPSRPIATCPSASPITCPTTTVVCPSRSAATCPQPSVLIRCPSGFVCGIEGPFPQPGFPQPGVMQPGFMQPGFFGAAGESPCGGQEAEGSSSGWEMYDPYAMWYGDTW